MMFRILVVDDHPTTCDGLAELLPMKDGGMTVVGRAYTGAEALALVDSQNPDVVVLDYALPDVSGADVAREMRGRGFPGRVLVFSGYDDEEIVREMLAAGVVGYVLKGKPWARIIEAVRAAARGEERFSAGVAAKLARMAVREPDFPKGLTAWQLEVLWLVMQGPAEQRKSRLIA
ncbi:MAG: response regulator, partial [Anaerolineales bacterium]